MFAVTDETLKSAVKRAFSRRARVSYVAFDAYDVRCDLGHSHRVRFASFDSDLYAECFDPQTGEACPSSRGQRLCYHVAAAVALRDGVEGMRVAALRSRLEVERSAATEHAVRFGGPLPLHFRTVDGRARQFCGPFML